MWVSGLVLVRQRPGNGNAIFLTLEDEGAVANIIVWPRVFERFRPIVLGGRFIRARGKLQAESGVIHIVAERFEDLTPWLADLTEVAATRRQAALPARAAAGQPPAAELSRQAGSVMPKGRNFQ